MKTMIVGASRGLGRVLLKGLGKPGDMLIGVSRKRPVDLALALGINLHWIDATPSTPTAAVGQIANRTPADLDFLICNVGNWEKHAFSAHYAFLDDSDEPITRLVEVNTCLVARASQTLIDCPIRIMLLWPKLQVLIHDTTLMDKQG
nr:hypothetical protein [Pseudomonas aeruginosa]